MVVGEYMLGNGEVGDRLWYLTRSRVKTGRHFYYCLGLGLDLDRVQNKCGLGWNGPR